MKKSTFCPWMSSIAIFFLLTNVVNGQTNSIKALPSAVKKVVKDFVFVEGGTYVHNLMQGFDSLQSEVATRENVRSFYLNRFEISVEEYLRFANSTDNPAALYDSTCWTRNYPQAYNEPLERNYFWFPMYRQHPMVCITWEQANLYCKWRSAELNRLLQDTLYKIEVRLPTEAEWQYAAISVVYDPNNNDLASDRKYFPWQGPFFTEQKKGGFYANCNSGQIKSSESALLMAMHQDGFLYTAPIKSYSPNGLGLYQMAGNVAEWTSDRYFVDTALVKQQLEEIELLYPDEAKEQEKYLKILRNARYNNYGIIKGGSWYDSAFYMQLGVFQIQDTKQARCTTGFRPALIVTKQKDAKQRRQ
ncbi:MAG: formylglycine-generating enzyme family protein [Saprospiraceae bacterium]